MPDPTVESQLRQQILNLKNEVSALRKNEAELRVAEERFQIVFNSMKDIYVEVDREGNLTVFNPAVCELFDYTADELMGMNHRDYTAPQTAKRLTDLFQQVYQTGAPSHVNDCEILTRKGKTHYLKLTISLIKNEAGAPSGFRCIGQDVTEKLQAEETLKKGRIRYRQLYKEAHQAEEIYQALLTSSPDAIVFVDAAFQVQFVNAAFTHIFGWNLAEMKDEKVSFVPKPLKQPFAALMQKVFDLDRPLRGYETQRYTKDGRLLDVSISASRYLDHAGNPSGIVCILRDITEVKRYEWHMQQAQKMESLGTLAGGIAHDFNNLLMGVQGRLSLLMLHKQSDDEDYKHLKEIEDYIVRAADLTRQMLGIARSGKFEAKPTDLNVVIKKQNVLFSRTRKEITLHEALDPALSAVEADQRQIEQVLLNMYVNAAHAMPDGGDLYVRTANVALDESRTSPYGLDPGRYVHIAVTDTGCGMDPATLKRVFEPFFTTREKGRGTGLGLASAYGIIKNHDGFITVYSEKGKGTTFNIYLPASGQAADVETVADQALVEGKGSILLIDDEEIIINVATDMIRALGYEVEAVSDGRKAIDRFRESPGMFDLVILDLIMPGMGGAEAFDVIKSIRPGVKILLSSGYSIDGQAAAIMKRGCDGFIQKPFSIQELSKKLSEVMNK